MGCLDRLDRNASLLCESRAIGRVDRVELDEDGRGRGHDDLGLRDDLVEVVARTAMDVEVLAIELLQLCGGAGQHLERVDARSRVLTRVGRRAARAVGLDGVRKVAELRSCGRRGDCHVRSERQQRVDGLVAHGRRDVVRVGGDAFLPRLLVELLGRPSGVRGREALPEARLDLLLLVHLLGGESERRLRLRLHGRLGLDARVLRVHGAPVDPEAVLPASGARHGHGQRDADPEAVVGLLAREDVLGHHVADAVADEAVHDRLQAHVPPADVAGGLDVIAAHLEEHIRDLEDMLAQSGRVLVSVCHGIRVHARHVLVCAGPAAAVVARRLQEDHLSARRLNDTSRVALADERARLPRSDGPGLLAAHRMEARGHPRRGRRCCTPHRGRLVRQIVRVNVQPLTVLLIELRLVKLRALIGLPLLALARLVSPRIGR